MAETLGSVSLSTTFDVGQSNLHGADKKGKKKLIRHKGGKQNKDAIAEKVERDLGKTQLVEVAISEGNIEDIWEGIKRDTGTLK